MGITHLTFDFGFGNQGGNRVDHQYVDGIAAHQSVGDVQRVFTAVRLGDQQFFQLDADFRRIPGINGVFGVDDGAPASRGLGVGDDMQAERGFAGRFRSEDFHDASGGQSADAECDVQRQTAGTGYRNVGIEGGGIAEAHDGAFSEFFFDLADGNFKIFIAIDLLVVLFCGHGSVFLR